jgi:Tol biopolymer transport system component
MRRPQVPYVIAASLVFVISIAVLAGALATGGLLEERVAPDASPSPSASRAPIELSRTGRLAYWRTDSTAGTQLWVSNIDGGQRRAITKVDTIGRVSTTRWSPDGEAIAYLDRGGQSLIVIRLDGARSELALPAGVGSTGGRLIDLDWSTDSRSLAATQRDPQNQTTDVYVASAAGGAWRNVTLLRNAFLSQWISADELLIHTANGLVGVQRADGSRLRPLTGQVATSPFLGDDGRVYYLAGQIAPALRDAIVPVLNAAQAGVWSMTIDGGDVRQETPQRFDDVRLVTRWSPDRFVVRQGASTALAFVVQGTTLATIPGVVDRVVFTPDRRTAIGLTSSEIVRYDTARPDTPVVLLTGIAQPDAWYPVTVTIARASASPAPAAPPARYTFALGGLIWATDRSGEARPLRQLQTDDRGLRRFSVVAVPQWSPAGDRILYFDVLANSFVGAVFVTDATGTGGRLSDQDAVGPFPTWSPDGNVAYADLISSRDSSSFSTAGEVRIVAPTNGARVATYPAREVAFGGGTTFLIDNGELNPPLQSRVAHSILEVTSAGSRTVTTAASVSAGSPYGGLPGTSLQLSMLGASADGAFVSVRISPAAGTGSFEFVVLRVSDGTPLLRRFGQDVADIRWSPTGHLIGMTLRTIPIVLDIETGMIIFGSDGTGRFAGWSPDGTWYYTARDTGLYAQPIKPISGGDDAVRISSLAVPVSATTP